MKQYDRGIYGEVSVAPAEIADQSIQPCQPSAHCKELAEIAGSPQLAEEVASSVPPKNRLEAMLEDQLAAAHNLAMRMAGRAAMHTNNAAHDGFGPNRREYHSVECARAANAAARVMESFQRGLLTLHKLRGGGIQTVAMQRISVSEGGQAFVAGVVAKRNAGSDDGPA